MIKLHENYIQVGLSGARQGEMGQGRGVLYFMVIYSQSRPGRLRHCLPNIPTLLCAAKQFIILNKILKYYITSYNSFYTLLNINYNPVHILVQCYYVQMIRYW